MADIEEILKKHNLIPVDALNLPGIYIENAQPSSVMYDDANNWDKTIESLSAFLRQYGVNPYFAMFNRSENELQTQKKEADLNRRLFGEDSYLGNYKGTDFFGVGNKQLGDADSSEMNGSVYVRNPSDFYGDPSTRVLRFNSPDLTPRQIIDHEHAHSIFENLFENIKLHNQYLKDSGYLDVLDELKDSRNNYSEKNIDYSNGKISHKDLAEARLRYLKAYYAYRDHPVEFFARVIGEGEQPRADSKHLDIFEALRRNLDLLNQTPTANKVS